MGEKVPVVVVKQPKLASQEDITEETLSAVPKSTYIDDPVFEPLKHVMGFRVRQVQEAQDIDDDDENCPLRFEIKNLQRNLFFTGTKKLGELTRASCHDGRSGCSLAVETVQGKPVMELEGTPGYSGLEKMRVMHGRDLIGEVIQNYDCCSSCNPQYTIFGENEEELLHLMVLDGGFWCGLLGVTKFMIVSAAKDTILGEIDNDTQRIRPWNRKLLADERRPLSEIRVVLGEQLSLEAKILLIAAAFTVNFHETVFRFERRRREYDQFEPLK